ncbi:MAG: restriction endonuclease subunit S [Sulfitobacter sp.]
MKSTEIPSEVDIHSYEGLTRLFRFGVNLRNNEAGRAALALTEGRFGLPAYIPEARGALEDTARHLDKMGSEAKFEKVCALISAASTKTDTLADDLCHELSRLTASQDIVRFSFAPAILPCLLHAKVARARRRATYPMYAIRYAGIGPDVLLMAFASLFLNLPIYTEINPPWDPHTVFDEDEPNTELPDVEITFPPAEFRLQDKLDLEESVRKSKLPRVVDRGKLDLESTMIDYLCGAHRYAFAFVSESFVSSTKQSRSKARQNLLNEMRIRRVAELTTTKPPMIMIELNRPGEFIETIKMVSTDDVENFCETGFLGRERPGKSGLVSIEEIQTSGDNLVPKRYLAKGPAGGRSIADAFANIRTPLKFRLADLFEVIRPKTTKNNPSGDENIKEVRPSDIHESGDLSETFRKIALRDTVIIGLQDQRIKAGDLLFAHRGPVGRVGYVTKQNIQNNGLWAAQSLLIVRPRKQKSGRGPRPYCDPRVLFMYLLSPKVRNHWVELAIGDRSPSIPIGEVERFGLPENLILQTKPKKADHSQKEAQLDTHIDVIIAEFEARQRHMENIRDLEKKIASGIDHAWETAWAKSLEK